MWIYEKKLQYPVRIKNPNPRLAGVIISQLGGPDGELAAATRYLNQRYVMPSGEAIGMLTDIGKEDGYCSFVAVENFAFLNCKLYVNIQFALLKIQHYYGKMKPTRVCTYINVLDIFAVLKTFL